MPATVIGEPTLPAAAPSAATAAGERPIRASVCSIVSWIDSGSPECARNSTGRSNRR